MRKNMVRQWIKLVGVGFLVCYFVFFTNNVSAAAKLEDLVDASKSNPNLPDPTRFGIKMELSDKDLAKRWLTMGLDPNYEAPVHGSGLMIAAWNGDIPLMQIFVDAGADVNFLNKSGESALLMAAWKNQFEAVKWLVDKGAQINPPNFRWSAFHYAVFAGHQEIAKWLLEKGAHLDAQIPNGSTALMLAMYESKIDVANWLLDKGARVDLKNDRGHDAFLWSMRYKHKSLARRIGGEQKYQLALLEPQESWGLDSKSIDAPERLKQLWTQQRYAQGLGNVNALPVIEKNIAKVLQEMAKAGAIKAPPVQSLSLALDEPSQGSANHQNRQHSVFLKHGVWRTVNAEESAAAHPNVGYPTESSQESVLERMPKGAQIKAQKATGQRKIELIFEK